MSVTESISYEDHLREAMVTDDDYKARPVCSVCGSGDVVVDAFARWDIPTQSWTLTATYPNSASCEECSYEAKIIWQPLED